MDRWFVPCPRHAEQLLAEELAGLGLDEVRPGRAGVRFRGGREQAYRA